TPRERAEMIQDASDMADRTPGLQRDADVRAQVERASREIERGRLARSGEMLMQATDFLLDRREQLRLQERLSRGLPGPPRQERQRQWPRAPAVVLHIAAPAAQPAKQQAEFQRTPDRLEAMRQQARLTVAEQLANDRAFAQPLLQPIHRRRCFQVGDLPD